MRLLDNVQIGPQKEKDAVALLSELDESGFRELIHIPNRKDLLDYGMSIELVDSVDNGIGAKLEGWLKVANIRLESDRGRVRAFNKLKHHMLAFYSKSQSNEIFVPSDIRMYKTQNIIKIKSATIEVSANMVRKFVNDAIMTQAVLWDTLALILWTRFDEQFDPPQWVINAYNSND